MPERADAEGDSRRPYTLVYVHGILNKPPQKVLKQQWDEALFEEDMGARTRMAYWADLRYAQPLSVGTSELLEEGGPATFTPGAIGTLDVDAAEVEVYGPEARDYAERLAARVEREASLLEGGQPDPEQTLSVGAKTIEAKIIPLPPLRRWLTRRITQALIRDTAAYFFDPEQRTAVRERLRRLLVADAGPYIVIAHSMGTVIAYDVLRELEGDQNIKVDHLLTFGSPLGLQEVQDNLGLADVSAERVRKDLSRPRQLTSWTNFADRLDPVSLDRDLADDFTHASNDATPCDLEDVGVVNPLGRRFRGFNPHAIEGYLSIEPTRTRVRELVGQEFTDALSDFVIAKDVAWEMTGTPERVPVLIELAADPGEGGVKSLGERLGEEIAELVASKTVARSDMSAVELAELDVLQRFVSAKLTSEEIDVIAARHKNLAVAHVWMDAEKRALLDRSINTIQVNAAHSAYGALGDGIRWAVLDTGIANNHPHFSTHSNVKGVWDCTRAGTPATSVDRGPRGGAKNTVDPNGHGTHVAGIIAGEGKGTSHDPPGFACRGIAPLAELEVFKVLADNGRGSDSYVIKALDRIRKVNDDAGQLVIHGVNLSLGGSFDPSVYGCGHSPICQELRRLWRQGVLVCVAAGNEGRVMLETLSGREDLNLDLSIGDPANLEDAIAVGAVHKSRPHTYGTSFFSSRGPTADGRLKPDVVAPGEKIVSCNGGYMRGATPAYVALSGTSMACPHVSGLLAAFLSVRKEFIGFPDRVKEILVGTCTDLKRDRYQQGHGMPNLIQMLVST